MRIRRFEPADLDQILRIERHAFPKSAYTGDVFLHCHRVSPETFLVLETENILGYIVFETNGHVISLAVDPEHRRRKIASRLLKACADRVKGDRLRVEVRKGNTAARAFYEKLGFRYRGRIRLYYDTEDAYVLETSKMLKQH